MLSNPLHQPEWLAHLRQHELPSLQLIGHLLTTAGPSLTTEWLDRLCQYGPRTGIPGLYTLYDVTSFSRQHESIIEQIITAGFKGVDFVPEHMAICYTHFSLRQTKRQRRTRRARVAVYMATMLIQRYFPSRLAQARQWELHRHQIQ